MLNANPNPPRRHLPRSTAVLAFVTIAACAQVNAIVLQQPDATRLTGDWEGTYTCDQGLTGVTLSMTGTATGQVTGVLDFHSVPENPQLPNGRYTMQGSFTVQGDLVLTPQAWVTQPNGFRMVGLNGNVDILTVAYSGTIPQCRKPFKLSKVRSETSVTAEPPAQAKPTPSVQPALGVHVTKEPPSAPNPATGTVVPGASKQGASTAQASQPVSPADNGATQKTQTKDEPSLPRDSTRILAVGPAAVAGYRRPVGGNAAVKPSKEVFGVGFDQERPGKASEADFTVEFKLPVVEPRRLLWAALQVTNYNQQCARDEFDMIIEVIPYAASGKGVPPVPGKGTAAHRVKGTCKQWQQFDRLFDVTAVVRQMLADHTKFAGFDLRLAPGPRQGRLYVGFNGPRGDDDEIRPQLFLAEANTEVPAPKASSQSADPPTTSISESAGTGVFAGEAIRALELEPLPPPKNSEEAALRSPLCTNNEDTFLRCVVKGKGKEAALCGMRRLSWNRGSATFRFGSPGRVDIQYPAKDTFSTKAFAYQTTSDLDDEGNTVETTTIGARSGPEKYAFTLRERRPDVGNRVEEESDSPSTDKGESTLTLAGVPGLGTIKCPDPWRWHRKLAPPFFTPKK